MAADVWSPILWRIFFVSAGTFSFPSPCARAGSREYSLIPQTGVESVLFARCCHGAWDVSVNKTDPQVPTSVKLSFYWERGDKQNRKLVIP